MEGESQASRMYADMPRDQLEYFGAATSAQRRNFADVNPQSFLFDRDLGCPHEVERGASKQSTGDARSASGSAMPRFAGSQRPDIISKYKQYFSGNNTPIAQSVPRSERSASRMSESTPTTTLGATAGVSTVAKPKLTQSQRGAGQPTEPHVARLGGYAPLPQEPQKPTSTAPLRSEASSAKPVPSGSDASGRGRVAPQQALHKEPPARVAPSRLDEYPIAARPQKQFGTSGDPASVSTRASEPQVVSCQPYESRSHRAESELSGAQPEVGLPHSMMPALAHPEYGRRDPRHHNEEEEIPESSMGQPDTGDVDDAFSSHGGSRASGDGDGHPYPPAVNAISSNEPPRRPSYSRMSRSTASIATVSSAHHRARPTYTVRPSRLPDNACGEEVPDGGDNHAVSNRDAQAFKPANNTRNRNLAVRRPDYGEETAEEADRPSVNQHFAPDNEADNGAELDNPSEDIMMPESYAPQHQTGAVDRKGVFDRLYSDAQRYNQDRADRERLLERQRMYERGEISSDDEIPIKSPETAHLRKSTGENSGEGKGETPASESKKKRHVDFHLFDRLAKPSFVSKKFVQIQEEKENERVTAARKAEEDHLEEMSKVAKYSWDVPAAHFKYADLQRQNALFLS